MYKYLINLTAIMLCSYFIGCGTNDGGTANSAKDIGEECSSRSECKTGECLNNKCVGLDGDSCSARSECLSGACIDYMCVGNEANNSCEPDCSNMECGTDSVCNEPCGTCTEGEYCSNGKCEQGECTPDCSNLECGPDPVCSRSCGTCSNNEHCSSGACVENQCIPNCSNLECGTDPVCNESCGTCTEGKYCSNGKCEQGECTPDCNNLECGPDPVCSRSCGTCSNDEHCSSGNCVENQCNPDCSNVECGPDPECGISCGTCEDNEECNNNGKCTGNTQNQCNGTRLSSSGALDFDLKMIQLSGTVTLNNSTLPDKNQYRGAISFIEIKSGSLVTYNLNSTGAFTYKVSLAPGTYNISYTPNTSLCYGADQPEFPCVYGFLHKNLSLNNSGSLNLNIQSVKVQGQVTVNNSQMQSESGNRGALMFTLEDGGSFESKDFQNSGNFTYATTLIPGKYTIGLIGNPNLCWGNNPSSVPCNSGILKSEQQLTANGVLNINIPTVQVQERVTINNNQIPDSTSNRGSLLFTMLNGGGVETKDFGNSGDFTYTMTLIKGNYDISLAAINNLCWVDSPSDIPCISGPLKLNQPLTASGALNIDIPTVKVQGRVTLNNSRLPDNTVNRGSLIFLMSVGGSGEVKDFENSGDFTYHITLIKGNYDISLSANGRLCWTENPSAIPCVSGPLKTNQQLTASGALNIDIPAVQVQGRVTVNGDEMPNFSENRGALLFTMQNGGSVESKDFDQSGDFTYIMTLIKGNYDISLAGNSRLCWADSPSAIPCISGSLKTNQQLTVSGALNIDIPTIQVQGNVSLNNNQIPDTSADRGCLLFHMSDGGTQETLDFDKSGAVTYHMTLISGKKYFIFHKANSNLCEPDAVSNIPCINQALFGCD